jgi:hypothetical protein
MSSSGILRRVALVRTNVSEEPSASFIRVTMGSPILITLMKEVLIPPKRRYLKEPHGVTSEKTPFLKVLCVQRETGSVVSWSRFLATDAEVSGSIPGAIKLSENFWV